MKRTWYILLFILICICTIISFRAYHYYAPPQLQNPYKVSNHDIHDDTIHIAFIGDSWAYMHKSHNCKLAQIIEDSIHCPVSVHSFGICGLTSKEIYENIFDDQGFKHYMQERRYDYCFVSAGINDTYKKMNSSYYKKSMEGIIDFLLANHIHPIILEIPDYNIIKSYERQTIKHKIIRRISMFVNRTNLNCKQSFRYALDELLKEKRYQDKVSIIRYKSWNNNYKQDLMNYYIDDQMHINEKGYILLDKIIGEIIIQNETALVSSR